MIKKKIGFVLYMLLGASLIFLFSRYLGNPAGYKSLQKIPANIFRYDVSLRGIDTQRLGFAVTPEFETRPKYWRDSLRERKESNKRRGGEIKPKRILIYDNNQWDYYNCPLNQKIKEFKCEYVDWQKIQHNTSFESIASSVDAILQYRDSAHKVDISMEPMHRNQRKKDLPKFIYFTLESPGPPHGFQMRVHSNLSAKGEGSRSYLASYWRGSDIYTPYHNWQYFDEKVTSKSQGKNYAKGRTKGAAIVVSNCKPNNNRMGLVKLLQQYIHVDVFGKCGDSECQGNKCFDYIKKNYRFYLSFENSNCRDYITEKLTSNAYWNDLLPVVLGAHPSDYKAMAPANSYVHLDHFDSVEALGRHLQLLSANDTLYNEYFAWKHTGAFRSNNFMCEVCAFLHAQDLKNTKIISKSNEKPLPYFNENDTYDFHTFNWTIHNKRLCLPPNEWSWNK